MNRRGFLRGLIGAIGATAIGLRLSTVQPRLEERAKRETIMELIERRMREAEQAMIDNIAHGVFG